MQGRPTSWYAAAAIVVLGLLAALPFQHAAVHPVDSTASEVLPAERIVWQETVTSTPPERPASVALASLGGQAAQVDDQVTPVAAAAPAITRTPDVPRVGEQYGNLLREYERRSGQRGGSTARVQTAASEPTAIPPRLSQMPKELPVIERKIPQSEASPPAPPVTHTIRDGDTLESIAHRYFGDAARGAEIFAANRGLLDSPDLLPIGKQLTIPSNDRPLMRLPAVQP